MKKINVFILMMALLMAVGVNSAYAQRRARDTQGSGQQGSQAQAGSAPEAQNSEQQGSPAPAEPTDSRVTASAPVELDIAILEASDYLNSRIHQGDKVAFVSARQNFPALSEYIIDSLIENAVNDRVFSVVDRAQLDAIRAEMDFQVSGDVSDESARSIGRMLGARTIVTVTVSRLGAVYRLGVRALEVESAVILGQINRNILGGATIAALADATSSGGTAAASAARSGGTPTAASGSGTQTASATTTAGGATVSPDSVPEGATVLNVNNAATLNTAINRIRNGGDDQTYVINVTGTVTIPVVDENPFGSVSGLTVTIQGGGTLAMPNANGSLLLIGEWQTVIARNITLRGRSNNNNAVIVINRGGIFRMEDGAMITGNTGSGYSGSGGGVHIDDGTFIMQGGTISGNIGGSSGRGQGGGVNIRRGTFTMQGGTISGNTGGGNFSGGGVNIVDGTFTMKGGTISGNTGGGVNYRSGAGSGGGGVRINGGTFTMEGGRISGNTGRSDGGGVYIDGGTFTKIGGSIHGSDAQRLRNTASQGHAVYMRSRSGNRWRNATAGPEDNTDGFGFWLNDD